MTHELLPIPLRHLGRAGFWSLPPAIASASERAAWRFIEFFTG